jgi:hypothetical protein
MYHSKFITDFKQAITSFLEYDMRSYHAHQRAVENLNEKCIKNTKCFSGYLNIQSGEQEILLISIPAAIINDEQIANIMEIANEVGEKHGVEFHKHSQKINGINCVIQGKIKFIRESVSNRR